MTDCALVGQIEIDFWSAIRFPARWGNPIFRVKVGAVTLLGGIIGRSQLGTGQAFPRSGL